MGDGNAQDGNTGFFALLVGIDRYINRQELPTLGGCVNDVSAMEQLLRDLYRVPVDNILKLTDSQATHEAIKRGFREHLIAAAQRWADGRRQGDPPALLFHYSCHGSQAIDETGTEPDGMDETICPHDSRTAGVYDIKDWELGALIKELTAHSDNVTIILDACHSGSGTRALGLTPRQAPPDMRPQPTKRPPEERTRGAASGPSDWLTRGKHVLLAGCRDRELSNEYRPTNGGHQQGVLSYFLIQELSKAPPDRPLLYRELHERVRTQVNAIYRDQTPQCEGDIGREVFGGARPERDVFLSVEEKKGSDIYVSGGAVHGLRTGSLLHVYPPGTRKINDAGAPIAALEVDEVGAVRSRCRTVAGQEGAPATAVADIPLNAPVLVDRINYGNMRRRVRLLGDNGDLLDQLRQRLAEKDVEPYVQIVDEGVVEFQIVAFASAIEIQDQTGTLLVAPFDPADVAGVAQDLTHLARYMNAL